MWHIIIYLDLQVNVSLEQCFFGTHANSCTHDLSGSRKFQSSDFKLGKHQPELRKSELFVRHKSYCSFVDLPCPTVILQVAWNVRTMSHERILVSAPWSQFPQTGHNPTRGKYISSNAVSHFLEEPVPRLARTPREYVQWHCPAHPV